jgi:PAS domain S-box-containing protein
MVAPAHESSGSEKAERRAAAVTTQVSAEDSGSGEVALAHEQFLIALRDRLRNETDTDVILGQTTERLAHHFGASRTGYGEVDDAQETFYPRNHWIDGSVVSISDPLPFAIFGEQITGGLKRGETWVHESLDDAHLDQEGREICRELGIVAAITVPLVKNSRFVALLSVQQSTPRRWHPEDVALVHEVADRTWLTLERAHAEEARRASEEVLAAIMRHAPIGMYLKDLEGRYQLANAEMARVLHRPLEHITGRTAAQLLGPLEAMAITKADQEALTGETPVMRETKGCGRDGYEHSLSMRFPIYTNQRNRHLAGFEIDISALKRTEAELERSREALFQAEKITALGSLLAGVSHELNNPLSIIVAQAELLEMDAAGTPAAARAMAIRSAAERSARIVQAFLAMARQKRPNRVRVDLNDVVRAAVDLLGYGLRSHGIRVQQTLAPDLMPINADPDQLHQVIINLLINAQQALEGWGGERVVTITTRAGAARDTVCLTVCDTGPGIPEDVRRRIFEPFFTTKAQNEGTGVGLSFSQGMVESHQGSLQLIDSATGATFRVELPIGEASASAELSGDERPPAEEPGRRRRALVVDDEVQLAEALAEILRRLNFDVLALNSGAAARQVLAHEPFDLIVSDVRMPDVDGPALYDWLVVHRPELVPAISFATGDTLSVAAAQFLATVGRPYMEKPFTLSTVRKLIDAVDAARAV